VAVQNPGWISLKCTRGKSADRDVLIGFAPASTLGNVSFADVLDEASNRGYQRRLNARHSLDFRNYIQQPGSATIPLTFNLRTSDEGAWRLETRDGQLYLDIREGSKPLAQVDCQHRLGHILSLDIELPFMSFIELTEKEEIKIFNVINSKAKGLSPSLLDFHDARLAEDLGGARPELYIALFLKNDSTSPWVGQLDLGGTSGTARRATLNTMQKAVRHFLKRSHILEQRKIDEAATIVREFWAAISLVLPKEWNNPRKHLLCKAVGVHALMEIAADMVKEAGPVPCNRKYFAAALSEFAPEFDWSSKGRLKGYGGLGGVAEAARLIREFRRQKTVKVVRRAK
jgi:DNA sulfur modification protein DndB